MAVETVDIEFRARLADFKRELQTMPGLTKKAARDLTSEWVSTIKRAEKESGSSIAAAAKEAEKLEKIATAIGGSVGDGIRQIGSLAKGAGAGLGELGLQLVAIGATVGAIYLVGSAIGSVLTNVEAYTGAINSLSNRDLVTDEQVQQLYAATAGWTALGNQVSAFIVRIAAKIAPTFNKAAIGLAYFMEYASQITSGASLTEAGRAATAAAREIWDAQQKAMEAAQESKDATGEWGAETERITARVEALAAASIRSARLAADAARADAEAMRAAAEAREEERQYLTWKQQVGAVLIEQARLQIELQEEAKDQNVIGIRAVAAATQGASAAFDALQEDADNAASTFKKLGTATKQDWSSAINDLVETSRGFAHSLADLADVISDNQAANLKKDSAEYIRNRRKQFAAHKAAAIAEATINTALSVTKTLASYAYPVNVVLGALSLAAGVATIATIAAQKPSFHTGGVVKPAGPAPDEVSATLMQGEGVLTRRGVQALGGEQAVQAVNRGAPTPTGASTVTAIAMLDGRVLDAVWAGSGPSGRGGLASRVDSRLRGGLSGRSQRGR